CARSTVVVSYYAMDYW
nr:immunoglobulin heavy chain junction region [Mus musculus]